MDRLARSHQPSIDSVLERVSTVLLQTQRKAQCGTLDAASTDKELSELITNLSRIEGSGTNIPEDLIKKSIQSINDLKQNLPNLIPEQDLINRYDQTNPNPHGKGRHQLDIDVNKLQQLMSLGFTVKKIAEDGLLGGKIHPNTLYKLLKEHDLQVRSSYSTITDDQLEEKVAEYNREHPNAGLF
ncbi:Hypothetical predicted protein [Mytilus galloprovincialis]|uniref:Uncharacterized protein n=1 Tax=Mytilus galloprovincialis TaxID=29158 RepID=A0A8B6DI84_MYTGA|nr:Hypothetical predicted protein [Mytilus galloprovincialis]